MSIFRHMDHVYGFTGCCLWMIGQVGKNRWTSIFYQSVSDQSLFLDWLSKIEKSNIIISQ